MAVSLFDRRPFAAVHDVPAGGEHWLPFRATAAEFRATDDAHDRLFEDFDAIRGAGQPARQLSARRGEFYRVTTL